MIIKLTRSQWNEMGRKAGWLGPTPRPCNCGSGEIAEPAYDARGIFLTNVCPKCRKAKLSKYRKEVLRDPNYEADEPIEPEASAKKTIKISEIVSQDRALDSTSNSDPDDNVHRRRSVKVTMQDGDIIHTDINGTKQEIIDYYLNNEFVKNDEKTLVRGAKVEFLK